MGPSSELAVNPEPQDGQFCFGKDSTNTQVYPGFHVDLWATREMNELAFIMRERRPMSLSAS